MVEHLCQLDPESGMHQECVQNHTCILLRVKKACEAFFLKEIILMPIICIDSAVQCCPDDIAVRPAVYLYIIYR